MGIENCHLFTVWSRHRVMRDGVVREGSLWCPLYKELGVFRSLVSDNYFLLFDDGVLGVSLHGDGVLSGFRSG